MKNLVTGFGLRVWVLLVAIMALCVPLVRAWDRVVPDQDFSGDVILERGIFVGPQNSFPYRLPISMTTNAATNAVMVITNLNVSGTLTVGTTQFVTSASSATAGSLTVQTNATVAGTLGVTGATTLKAATINGAVASTNASWTLSGIPTSTNGLTTGRLWSNAGVLQIAP